MPRHARIMLPGAAVHLMQRGNNRADCFFCDDDRRFYLVHLARLLPAARCDLHAYCLMTNHIHLLVTAHEMQSCARLMHRLDQLYAQYINKTYRRTGSLWEGRYKSCLVQTEVYLLTCYQYIELNPVRARLAATAADYAWSSFRSNGCGDACDFVVPHGEYLRLGRSAEERRAAYRDTLGSLGVEARFDEIRQATNAGYVAGDAGFKSAMARMVGRRVQAGTPGRPSVRAREQANGELFPS
ncbi:MAG TPA: transposase [Burkholderiales bacterium]